MMKGAARIVGIFLLQVVTLLLATRLIGAPIMSATVWRVPMGSCYGYDIDFRFMIGLSAASVLVAVVLDLKRCCQSTVWTFIAALVTLDILYSAHPKVSIPLLLKTWGSGR